MSATAPEIVDAWVAEVWARTRIVTVLPPLDGTPVRNSTVLLRLTADEDIARLRELTGAGRYIGSVVRSLGAYVLRLSEGPGRVITEALIDPSSWVAWNRSGFYNDVLLADPVGATMFLAERGLDGALVGLLPMLVERLGRGEGKEQFRAAGDIGVMAARRVPEVLWSRIAAVGGAEIGAMPDTQAHSTRPWCSELCCGWNGRPPLTARPGG